MPWDAGLLSPSFVKCFPHGAEADGLVQIPPWQQNSSGQVSSFSKPHFHPLWNLGWVSAFSSIMKIRGNNNHAQAAWHTAGGSGQSTSAGLISFCLTDGRWAGVFFWIIATPRTTTDFFFFTNVFVTIICCCSVAELCPALCNPMNCSTPVFPVVYYLPDLYPLSQWCHPIISPSVVPFSSLPQSFSAPGSFPMSWLSAWGGQNFEASASASQEIMNLYKDIRWSNNSSSRILLNPN